MSGPKHLWSGNWQEESDAASKRRADLPDQPEEAEETQPLPSRRVERRRRPTLPILFVAVLFLAAAAFGLAAVLGSGSKSATTGTQLPHLLNPGPPNPGFTNPGSTNPGQTSPPSATVPTTPTPTPTTPTQPSASPTPTTPANQSRPISWLGMEIETLPPGAAVIETVALGSAGDKAGLNPGDVIIAINGRAITGAHDIGAAIRGLPSGDQVPIQISHGSTLEQTEITLGAPPSVHP
jgi:membrane-associated protease RseP (regulator of RpoE activity)